MNVNGVGVLSIIFVYKTIPGGAVIANVDMLWSCHWEGICCLSIAALGKGPLGTFVRRGQMHVFIFTKIPLYYSHTGHKKIPTSPVHRVKIGVQYKMY